jgi:alkylation response protein AidB-like acyl-CoA dehydrogenase
MPVLEGGSPAQKTAFLPDLAGARKIATLALTEPGAGHGADAVQVRAEENGGDFTINGTKLFVPYAGTADLLLCAARTAQAGTAAEGVTLFLLDGSLSGINLVPLKTMGGDRLYEVDFREARVSRSRVVGDLNRGWPLIESVLAKAAVALSAEMIGGAQAVMEMALRYARERIQFGRPIGSFQSIQHYFADMWADITGSRHLLYRTAWEIAEGHPAAVVMTKARAGRTYRRTTAVGHQIFGAIGFTEEHDVHLYHKRSVALDNTLDGAEYHYLEVADRLFAGAGG